MPPLSDELFRITHSKERPIKGLGDLSMDNSDRNNSEFLSLKEVISQTSSNQTTVQSRNTLANSKTSSSFAGKPVPKLDFKRLKKVQEFKDWYAYATKLEDSVTFLRQRVKNLEQDQFEVNAKYRKE